MDIKKRRSRFIQISKRALASKHFANLNCIHLSDRIVVSGVLNEIWDYWNSFWREYWLLHIQGGVYFNNAQLSLIQRTNRQDSLFYMLYLLGKKKNPNGTVLGSYQEATWGDIKNIISLATNNTLLASHAHLNYVSTLLSIYSDSIKDFQTIRNAFIHLDKSNINNVKLISNRYSFAPNQNTLHILNATHITSGKITLNHLIDDMIGLMLNL